MPACGARSCAHRGGEERLGLGRRRGLVYPVNGVPRPDQDEGERDPRQQSPRGLGQPVDASPRKRSVRSVGAELAAHGLSITAADHAAQDGQPAATAQAGCPIQKSDSVARGAI